MPAPPPLTCRPRPVAVSPSPPFVTLYSRMAGQFDAGRGLNGKGVSVEQKTPDSGGGPDRPARHVGSRKRARGFPKGRQLDNDALQDIKDLLRDKPRRADLLIEYLHLIQDRYQYISAAHLKALCEEMRLPQAAAYEVATFYAHFDVVKEGETPPHRRRSAYATPSLAPSRAPRRFTRR